MVAKEVKFHSASTQIEWCCLAVKADPDKNRFLQIPPSGGEPPDDGLTSSEQHLEHDYHKQWTELAFYMKCACAMGFVIGVVIGLQRIVISQNCYATLRQFVHRRAKGGTIMMFCE